MKKILKATLRSLIALSFISIFAAAPSQAQSRDARLISARAGGVNFVSGDVNVKPAGRDDWQRLSVKDNLKSGDTARTGPDGRVEVLLNPGSYFRAGEGTEFTLADDSLDSLQLTLARGSTVIEATGYDDLDLSITINMPKSRVRLVRSGVYRVNVQPGGVTEVAVYKGRALVGDGETVKVVKGGNTIRLDAGGVETAKLDKSDRDALDLWSRDRGKELAKENSSLSSRRTNSLFAQTSFNGFFPSNYGYGGVWAWSAGLGCYTFLPFAWGWQSPYGYGYGSIWAGGFGACGCGYNPSWRGGAYTPQPNRNGGNPPWGGTTNGGNGGNNGATPHVPTPPPPSTPLPPVRDVPSSRIADRPMPAQTREPRSQR